MGRGTLEIKDNGQKIEAAQFLAEGIQDRFAFGGEASQDEHAFLSNGINHLADFCIVAVSR